VIIHAGPHKTASTTIQQILMRKSRVGTLLADGYETLGQSYFSGCPPPWPSFPKDSIKNHATLAFALQGRCPNNDTDGDNSTRPPPPPLALLQLSDFMSTAFSNNHSIILSTEEFAQPYTNLSLFHDQLHHLYFNNINVHSIVILYYRRLLEWLPSIYFEIHKRFAAQHGAVVFPSFVEWLSTGDTLASYLQLYPWAVKERFITAGFKRVKILPMPKNSTNTTVQFICDHVPGADETCRALLRPAPVGSSNKRIEKTVFNSGTSLEYDRIMALAIQAGLIVVNNDDDEKNATVVTDAASNKNHTTNETMKHVAVQRLQAALTSQPESFQQTYRTCLPKHVRTRVLELALFFEEKMACGDTCNYGSDNGRKNGTSTQPQQEGDEEMTNQLLLQMEFSALLESEKLCSWNAQLLLQNEEWKAFFQSLGRRKLF
jgi:hypothetical protein